MRSAIVKHSIGIAGHKTSVTLEDAFWNALKEIASEHDMSLSELVATIDEQREQGNLSSAIRIFVFDVYRNQFFGEREEGKATPNNISRPARVFSAMRRVRTHPLTATG
jgi:predicted DNA-binding ribbon-helix-helix protein